MTDLRDSHLHPALQQFLISYGKNLGEEVAYMGCKCAVGTGLLRTSENRPTIAVRSADKQIDICPTPETIKTIKHAFPGQTIKPIFDLVVQPAYKPLSARLGQPLVVDGVLGGEQLLKILHTIIDLDLGYPTSWPPFQKPRRTFKERFPRLAGIFG